MKSMQHGQVLVAVLVSMFVAITLITAAVSSMVVSSRSSTVIEQGTQTLMLAESGAENALVRLIRDSTYPGETLTIEGSTVIVEVVGGNPITIRSSATNGPFTRKVSLETSIQEMILTVGRWKEMW